MKWYLLNILILTIVYCYATNKYEENVQKKMVCFVGTFNWILLSGLRHISIGTDTQWYKVSWFDGVLSVSWETLFNSIINKYLYGIYIKDIGYLFFEKVFQILSTDYQVYLLFIACVFFIPMGMFLYKYSVNPYISFVLFSTLFFGFFAITGHRQTIATALVVFGGIDFILKRRAWCFFMLLILASTIHNSVWAFAPFYFLSQFKVNKKSIIVYIIFIVLSFIFSNELLNILQFLAGYESYGQTEGARLGVFVLCLFIITIVVVMYRDVIIAFGNETIGIQMTQAAINALFIAVGLSSLLMINQNFMRVVQYYSLFLMLILPLIPWVFGDVRVRWLVRVFAILLLVTFLIIHKPEYMFFWQ